MSDLIIENVEEIYQSLKASEPPKLEMVKRWYDDRINDHVREIDELDRVVKNGVAKLKVVPAVLLLATCVGVLIGIAIAKHI